jgi:phosphatidylinositol-4,5-bisphosphate 3-kinase/phosphatidylinositol-4-phosphate 3-kinase
MLSYWPLLPDPAGALELLKPRFVDKHIREFTIRNLQRLSDSELADYLLQLVQALKHEMHHDSPLARFLLVLYSLYFLNLLLATGTAK